MLPEQWPLTVGVARDFVKEVELQAGLHPVVAERSKSENRPVTARSKIR